MSGYVDYDLESGKCAYEAYRQTSAERSPKEPEWKDLPIRLKEAWQAAAEAAIKREAERATQF